MYGDEGTSPNKEGDGVSGPEEQKGRGRGPRLFVVGVSEEDCGKQGERFEDVGLEDRNVDMTKNDVGEICQTDGKGGPEQGLYSLGITEWSGVSSAGRNF